MPEQKPAWNKRTVHHLLSAQWRDARVLWGESRRAILAFAVVVLAGALVLRLCYIFPDTHLGLAFDQALYAAFALVFFETILPLPEQWYLQIFFYVIPVFGLAAVADGVLRFGAALINKQSRGQKWQVALASTFSDHIIVCGLGKVGFRTVQELRKFGREVVIIEREENGPFAERLLAAGVPVLFADARRPETLQKAGVERADAIIPCTDDDLTNLDIALDARELNPAIRVVMRTFDPDLARRIEAGFGIDAVYSTSALAAPIFAAAAMRADIKHSFYVNEKLLNIGEQYICAESPLLGWSIERLGEELDLSIVLYEHAGEIDLHPGCERALCAGDRVLVLASLESLQKLQALNAPVCAKR